MILELKSDTNTVDIDRGGEVTKLNKRIDEWGKERVSFSDVWLNWNTPDDRMNGWLAMLACLLAHPLFCRLSSFPLLLVCDRKLKMRLQISYFLLTGSIALPRLVYAAT